jgi:serine/threonine protein phosphatase PrpC
MKRTELALGWKSIAGYRHQLEGRENEDAVFVSEEHPLFDAVMIVADGMGGHQEPKRAAETAAGTARDLLFARARWSALGADPAGARRLLQDLLAHANEAVLRLAPLGSPGRPPGTTLTVAVVWNGLLFIRAAGDGTTFLMREGRLQALVGGEERRSGNRPQSFLGMAPRIETEERVVELRVGDRILICTDGLTRYFGGVEVGQVIGGAGAPPGETGPALLDVLGRPNADPQTIANQLTAHSRGDRYDDDTTVVVAEVQDVYEVAEERPGVVERGRAARATHDNESRPTTNDPRQRVPTNGSGPAWVWAVATAVLGMVAGLAMGRWLWPAPARPVAPSSARAADALAVSPGVNAPREAILLQDAEGKRLFSLRPGPSGTLPREGKLKLQGVRMLRSGELTAAGSWQLDLRRSRLTDPRGRSFFVDVDAERGVITARRAGTLRVTSPGAVAEVSLDGIALGRTPIGMEAPAGKHRLRLEWRDGRVHEEEVTIPRAGRLSVEWGP